MRETTKMIAKIMVILSKFLSTTPEPVELLYRELAIASATPVPLPECKRMKIIKPTPDKIRMIVNIIATISKTIVLM